MTLHAPTSLFKIGGYNCHLKEVDNYMFNNILDYITPRKLIGKK